MKKILLTCITTLLFMNSAFAAEPGVMATAKGKMINLAIQKISAHCLFNFNIGHSFNGV